MTRDEILLRVQDALVETLAVEPEDVIPQARFFEDLEGESIDVLDLSFRLEKTFGVKIPLQALSDHMQLTPAGILTEESADALAARFPFLMKLRDRQQMMEHPSDLFNVQTIVDLVDHFLQQESKASSQNSETATSGQIGNSKS